MSWWGDVRTAEPQFAELVRRTFAGQAVEVSDPQRVDAPPASGSMSPC